MYKNNPGTFKVDGNEYPIKPCMLPYIQSYLHDENCVKWVRFDEPYVEYGVETRTGTKTIKRFISELLSETQFGRKIISNIYRENR